MALSIEQRVRLLAAVDRIDAIRGAGVGYEGDDVCQELRPSRHPSGLITYVIITEVAATAQPARAAPAPNLGQGRSWWQRYGREVLGAGLGCGGAALAAAGTVATGGALGILVGAGAVSAAGQCGISLGRIINSVIQPEANDWIDRDDAFQAFNTLLDVVGFAGAGAGTYQLMGRLAVVRGTATQLSQSRQVMRAALRRMSAAERQQLAREIARLTEDQAARAIVVDTIVAGRWPTRIFLRGEATLALRESIRREIRSAIVSNAPGVVGSALPSAISPSSGIINSPASIGRAVNWAQGAARQWQISLFQEGRGG